MHDFWILITAIAFFNLVIGGFNLGNAHENLRFDPHDRLRFRVCVGYSIFTVIFFVFCAVQVASTGVA